MSGFNGILFFRLYNEYSLEGMDALAETREEQQFADGGGIMSNVVQIGRQLLGYEPGLYSYAFLRKMAAQCSGNCSGHGQCLNGSCYCMIQVAIDVMMRRLASDYI